MGGLIPLSDASRQTRRFPAATVFIIAVNAIVFALELTGGRRLRDALVRHSC